MKREKCVCVKTMEKEHFLFITSEDSKDQHPGNTASDFTIELPRPLNLDGNWACSIREVQFPNNLDTPVAYICADLCQESLTCDTYYPVLRVVPTSPSKSVTTLTFTTPYYITVKQDKLQRFRIFIRGVQLRPAKFKSGLFSCTLHLKQV